MKLKYLLTAGIFAFSASLAHASTLEDTKARGNIQCGISQGLPGFSNPDAQGNWTGLDVDYCRAMSSAICSRRKIY